MGSQYYYKGEHMKKAVKIISMFLILVLVINCFAGCTLALPMLLNRPEAFVGGAVIDSALVVASLVAAIVVPLVKPIKPRRADLQINNEYLLLQIVKMENTAVVNSLLNNDSIFTDMYNSLSKMEQDSIINTVNLWDKINVDFFTASLNTLSEDEIAYSIYYFNSFYTYENKKYFFLNAFQPKQQVSENN